MSEQSEQRGNTLKVFTNWIHIDYHDIKNQFN